MTIAPHTRQAAIAALGDGPELTAEQNALLDIILDPTNNPDQVTGTAEEHLQDLLDTVSGNDVHDAEVIAGLLHTHIQRVTGKFDAFCFELVYSESDGYASYDVSTRIEPWFWLTSNEGTKCLIPSRHDLTGLRAILHIAETIWGDYQRVSQKRDELQLTQPSTIAPDPTATIKTSEEIAREIVSGFAPEQHAVVYASILRGITEDRAQRHNTPGEPS